MRIHHIHPNRMNLKQLFLNAKQRRLEFGGSKRPFFCLDL